MQVETDVLAQRLAVPVTRTAAGRTARPPSVAGRTAAPPDRPAAALGSPTPGVADPGAAADPGSTADPGAAAAAAGPAAAFVTQQDQPGPPTAGSDDDLSAFVGRENELNTLHSLAAETLERSDRRVALIAGDAGAGKSRLLARLTRELSTNGWRVVIGRCPESDGAPPAWAWVETIRALATEFDPGQLAPAMAPLLGEIAGTPGATDASFGRFLMSRAVNEYLRAVARMRPLAVVIDDLHRGDSETLALLDAVATGTSGAPLLLIAAYRPAEITSGLRDTLAGLAALPPARLRLGGLDAAHAARLIRSVAGVQPDAATLTALVDRTGGNPFYLTESARLLGSEGVLVATSKVPEGVRDVLRRRFARLPEVTVSVLRLAAVLGRDVDIDVLVRAAEVDEDTVLDALEAAVLAGLLTEPAPGSVRFGHVLVRDTLYDDAPRLRRGRWHARVGNALLSAQPQDVAALAHHFHQAATPTTARVAVDFAVRAADQAVSRYAHETASALYEQALADLDRVPAAGTEDGAVLAERVEILARLTRSQIAAGASIAAAQSRTQAMILAHHAGRRDLLIRVLTSWDLPTPWITRHYGTVDTAVTELIEEALSWSDSDLLDDASRCKLLCALVAEIGGELNARATEAAYEAERLARQIGDPVLIGLALHAMFEVTSAELQTELRVEIGNELLQIGAAPGLAVFALIGHHVLLGSAAIRLDFRGMAEQVDRLEALVRTYRWRQAEGTIEMHRGLVAHLAGRLDESEAYYAKGGELLRASGAMDAEGIALLALLSLRITQGRVAELWDSVQGIDTAQDVLVDLLAFPLTATGRWEQARQIRRSIRPVRRDFFHAFLLTLRGMIVVILQDPDEAAAVYPELLPYAGQIGGVGTGSYAAGPVDTVLGDLSMLLGRVDDAKAYYAVALDLSRQCGNDYWAEQARTRLSSVGAAS